MPLGPFRRGVGPSQWSLEAWLSLALLGCLARLAFNVIIFVTLGLTAPPVVVSQSSVGCRVTHVAHRQSFCEGNPQHDDVMGRTSCVAHCVTARGPALFRKCLGCVCLSSHQASS